MEIRIATTDAEWQQAMDVIHHVYVSEGHTSTERADGMFRRDVLDHEGTLFIAVDDAGAVIGATLFLNVGSSLQQVAVPGEREFRLLGVSAEARGSGAGAALVQACIDKAVEEDAIGLVLWTRPVMTAAQWLYERLLFERAPGRDEADPRGFQRLVYQRFLG